MSSLAKSVPKGTPFWRWAFAALAGSFILWFLLYSWLVWVPVGP